MTMRPRCGAGTARQAGNAASAAAIAAFTSSRVDSGVWPMMSSVLAGLILGAYLPEAVSTQ